MKHWPWSSLVLILCFSSSVPLSGADLVFFGNLHSHTSYSDGSGTPSQACKQARDAAKLDFLAITEHNHRLAESDAGDRVDGRLIATSPQLYVGPANTALIPTAGNFNKDGQFVALYGQEFSSISKGNHVNVFEVGEVIDDQMVPNGRFDSLLTWLQSHNDSTGQKAIIQFNHAKILNNFAIEYGTDDFSSQAWISRMSEHVSLFEMLNGPALTSTIYHVSLQCRSAQSIKESNRITGATAKEGRTKHAGCPVQ